MDREPWARPTHPPAPHLAPQPTLPPQDTRPATEQKSVITIAKNPTKSGS